MAVRASDPYPPADAASDDPFLRQFRPRALAEWLLSRRVVERQEEGESYRQLLAWTRSVYPSVPVE